jgi:hypothetical protein
LLVASARVSPVKHPEVLTYLIARRQGENLASRFVSVIEPFKGEPLIKEVRTIPLSRGSGTAIEILRSDGGSDIVVYDVADVEKAVGDRDIATDARVTVVRRDAAGRVSGRFFVSGTFLAVGGERLDGQRRIGPVVSVDTAAAQIRVKPEQPRWTPEDFVGRVVHFRNDRRRTAHTIVAARRQGDDVVLTASDDLLVGRARVDAVKGDAVATSTALPLAPTYRGVTLADDRFQPLARVIRVQKGTIALAAPIPKQRHPAPGADVWLVNVGAGDEFELPAVVEGKH